MTGHCVIAPAEAEADLQAVRALFEAYAAGLPIDLGYQDFAAELAGLPGKYAPPHGALLLARDGGGSAVGCVGLRPLEAGCCEMKRLYVPPAARGHGLGKRLAIAVIEAARRIGYSTMRLDTLDSLHEALALYEALGFVRIAPYYAPTPAGTVFLELGLRQPGPAPLTSSASPVGLRKWKPSRRRT